MMTEKKKTMKAGLGKLGKMDSEGSMTEKK